MTGRDNSEVRSSLGRTSKPTKVNVNRRRSAVHRDQTPLACCCQTACITACVFCVSYTQFLFLATGDGDSML